MSVADPNGLVINLYGPVEGRETWQYNACYVYFILNVTTTCKNS